MARQGITYEQVSAAIDQLIAEGANPTIMGIRELLGTGSPNTIHRHLNVWRAAAPVIERKPVDLPGELKGALVAEIEKQAAAARAEVEKELASTKSEASILSEAGEPLETENHALSEEAEALRLERERLTAMVDQRMAEIEKITGDLERERQAAESSRLELAKEQLKTEQLVKAEVELKEAVKEADKRVQVVEKEAAQAAQQAAVSEAKLDAEQATTKDLRGRLEAAEKRGNEVQKTIEALKAEHAQVLENLNIELRQALEAKAKTEREGDTQKHQIEALAREKNDLAAKVVELERTNAELTDKVKEVTEKPKRGRKPTARKEDQLELPTNDE